MSSPGQMSTVPVAALAAEEAKQLKDRPMVYAIVENQRGVLHRVSSMFRAKGFNIASISIGRTSDPDLSRMTIVPFGDDTSLALLVKQLRKMIDVIEVGTMTSEDSVSRELALVKFEIGDNEESRREILEISSDFGAKVIDSDRGFLVVEISSTPDRIDSFIKTISSSETLKEVVRTGVTALRTA